MPSSLIHQFVRSPISASRADKAIGPPACREIALTGFLGGEVALNLAQRSGNGGLGTPLHTYGGLLNQPDQHMVTTQRHYSRVLAPALSYSVYRFCTDTLFSTRFMRSLTM
jgi:hypothetical protein